MAQFAFPPRSFVIFLVAFSGALFLGDAVCFRWLYWRLPDESAWGELPHYYFERRARELSARERRPGEVRVLAVGSSIALYSILPERIEARLAAAGHPEVKVELLAHQGLTPAHLFAYRERVLATAPDLVALPINFVDFRLERPIMQRRLGDLDSGDPTRRADAYRAALQYLIEGPEFRVIAPGGTLSAYFAELDWNQRAGHFWATGLAAFRYRWLGLDAPALLFENRHSAGRSYHTFAGARIGGDGVTERGWTGAQFSFDLSERELERGIYLEAPAELFHAHPRPHLQLSYFRRAAPPGAAPYAVSEEDLARGWRSYRPPADARAGDRVKGELNAQWLSPDCACNVGVRLTRNAGLAHAARRSDQRPLRREDELYRLQSDAEYRASFEARILRFDRSGMQYLEALKMAKDVWAQRKFDPDYPTFALLNDFRALALERGADVLTIDSPENPISFEWYAGSSFRAGLRDFLAAPPRSGGPGRAYYLDLTRALPMQDFYDYHHLSLYGAERFSDRFADRLVQWLNDRRKAP
jgi:hypothetical protein